MSALAERLSTEKALQKERREVEKGSILRKLTRQHPAGMSAYSLWVELFQRQGDVSHVAGLLEELCEAKLVAASGGCWYAGAKVPANGIAPRAEPEPIVQLRDLEPATVATEPEREPGEESPLWFSTRLQAASDAGHKLGQIASRAIELGGYAPETHNTIASLLSAIRGGRTRGTSSIYRPGIELALQELGFGRDYRHGSQPAQVAPCTEEEGDAGPESDPGRDGSGEAATADRGGAPGDGAPEAARAADHEPSAAPSGREGEEASQGPRLIVEVGGNLDAQIERAREALAPLARLAVLDEAARVIADARRTLEREAELAQDLEQLRARVAELEQQRGEQEQTIARLRGLRDAALRALGEGSDG